jgi:hypothetical protein
MRPCGEPVAACAKYFAAQGCCRGATQAGGSAYRSWADRARSRDRRVGACHVVGAPDESVGARSGLVGGHAEWHVRRAARGGGLARDGSRTDGVSARVPGEVAMRGKVEKALLRCLSRRNPRGTRVIVISVAGFRTPWIRAVARLGWGWIWRVRRGNQVWRSAGEWRDALALAKQSSPQALRWRVNRPGHPASRPGVLESSLPDGPPLSPRSHAPSAPSR